MKMRILSEGLHERSGALEAFVGRLNSREWEVEHMRVADLKNRALHGSGPKYVKKALACLRNAKRDGLDSVVLVIDEDGERDRVSQMAEAQGNGRYLIARALGVAIRTFDAWMLADEKALTKVLGYRVQRQRDPESLRDPKGQCETLLGKSERELRQRDMYTEVARSADIEVMKKRCPDGFAPFARRVEQLNADSDISR